MFCDGCIGFFMIWKNQPHIRQRGIGNPNPVKLGRCIKELERIYGIRNGSISFQGNQYEVVTNKSEAPKKTQEQLAAQMGISVDTLQNYKLLSEMIPELSDLVDTGIVTKTTALTIMKELSEVNPCFYFYWSKIIWLDIFYI